MSFMSLKTAANSIGSRVSTYQDSTTRPEKFAPRAPMNEKRSSYDRPDKKVFSTITQNGHMLNNRKDALKTVQDRVDDSDEEAVPNENSSAIKEELLEARSKLKGISGKVSVLRKERDLLQKENKSLQEEVLTLQSSLRQMIPGFSNSESSFPLTNELITNASSFYKSECEDLFFDFLCPQLNMKGIIAFFLTSFHRLSDVVKNYFSPAEDSLRKTSCLTNLDGPIMSVLRKSFQATWRKIIEQCFTSSVLLEITNELRERLGLVEDSDESEEQIVNFLKALGELILCFYISDPPLVVDYKAIGSKVIYNATKHEALDGFIKGKEECVIILPSLHKNSIDGELLGKAMVLQANYEIPN